MVEEKNESNVAELGINDIPTVGLSVVIGGLILTYGGDIGTATQTELGQKSCAANTNGFTTYNETRGECLNSSTFTFESPTGAGFNVSAGVTGSFGALSSKYPTITRVLAAAIIIGTLVTAFQFRR